MNVHVKLTAKNEAYIIKNMYLLYLHDLSGHYGNLPNRHGIYETADHIQTLREQYDVQNIWWEKPSSLYPFLIYADEIPAGFALIATPPHCRPGIDFFVNDFFILQPFRGKGVAEQAAINVFKQLKGKCELFTNPSERNMVGQKFWRKTISSYREVKFVEEYGETFDGHKLIFQFDNTGM